MQGPQLKLVSSTTTTTKVQRLPMGVHVADRRHVPAGAIITTQFAADCLPLATVQVRMKQPSRRPSFQARPNLRVISNPTPSAKVIEFPTFRMVAN
jgi:hypothetical protein